jgi:NAD(P)-dependent dehydrogenase (short-subunit alcohol dehydrogenase family)
LPKGKAREHVLVVGSSGMGLALAERLLTAGAAVTIVGRSSERLAQAREKLGNVPGLQTAAADATREDDVERLFGSVGALHHIVSTAADVGGVYVPLPEMNISTARRVIDSKVVAPLLLAKHGAPRLETAGSITFTSGIAAYRPAPKGSVVAAINGAIESLVYALAVGLKFVPKQIENIPASTAISTVSSDPVPRPRNYGPPKAFSSCKRTIRKQTPAARRAAGRILENNGRQSLEIPCQTRFQEDQRTRRRAHVKPPVVRYPEAHATRLHYDLRLGCSSHGR